MKTEPLENIAEKAPNFGTFLQSNSQASKVIRNKFEERGFSIFDDIRETSKKISDIFANDVVTHSNLENVKGDTQTLANKKSFYVNVSSHDGIDIENCSNFIIDLTLLDFDYSNIKNSRKKFLFKITNCSNFKIIGGTVKNTRNFLLVGNSSNFIIENSNISQAEGYGIIIFSSFNFCIKNTRTINCLASGLYCLGNTHHGIIRNSTFHGCKGFYNWDAGVHLNHCTPKIDIDAIPERTHEDASILEKTEKPHNIFFINNAMNSNRAQGVYCEGAIECSFEGNSLINNNKEGICLDWGSSAIMLENNFISKNGERASLSPDEIRADFIQDFPQLNDGSSSCKLPGISIDNGCLNAVLNNHISMNYGGGLKMVRSGIGNIVRRNSIVDNDIGLNEFFTSFYPIFLLGMGTGNNEFIDGNQNLDFLPSQFNYISDNFIKYHNKVKAINHDEVSTINKIEKNIIVT